MPPRWGAFHGPSAALSLEGPARIEYTFLMTPSATFRLALQRTTDDSYDLFIQRSALTQLPPWLEAHRHQRRLAIITDSTVARSVGHGLLERLRALDHDIRLFEFAAGESSKTRKTKAILEDQMLEAGYGRDTLILALGGGVVGDMAGYVAATYHRGIGFVQVPTTLLAMVDSSVGGKTGVDTQHGKNLIGAFHQPEAVFIDPALLESLPMDQRKAGFAEMIKHGVILDGDYFARLEAHHERILALETPLADEAIEGSCRIKGLVVERDEKEADLRKVLNFGHTVGHAIETLADFQLLHGHAVALGMRYECALAVASGFLLADDATRINRLLDRIGYPRSISDLPVFAESKPTAADLVKAMHGDKKAAGGKVQVVLPKHIGQMAQPNGRYGISVEDEALVALFKKELK